MAARTGKALKAADLSDPARPRHWRLRRTAEFVVLLVVCLEISMHACHAAAFHWTGLSSDQWGDQGNWILVSGDSTTGIPGYLDEAVLGGSEYSAIGIDLGNGVTIRSLRIEDFSRASFKSGESAASALTIADGGRILANRLDADVTLGSASAAEFHLYTYRESLVLAGNIAGGREGTPGDKKLSIDGGEIKFLGIVSDGGSRTVGVSLKNKGIATFSASNTFTGRIDASFSAIALGASNVIADVAPVFLDGGEIVLNGFEDKLGSLSINGMSSIDFRKGGEISFADSGLTIWAGKLNLVGFNPGTDSLRFGTSASSLTQEQLRMISVPGYVATSINETGYVEFIRDETPRGPDFSLNGYQKANDGRTRTINANFVIDRRSTMASPILFQNFDPSNPLVLNGTVFLNGFGTRLFPLNSVLGVSGPGLVEFRDTIAEAYLNFLSLYVRDGNVALFGSNTYTGDTTVARSTLRMGASNVLPDRSMLVLDDGLLRTAGLDDTMRSLKIVGASSIDFGSGDSDLWFIDVEVWDPNGSLSLLNFDIGLDTLRFGSSAETLTDEQLSLIWLPGFAASLDSEGYVQFTAVPEPRGLVILAMFIVLVFLAIKFQISNRFYLTHHKKGQ